MKSATATRFSHQTRKQQLEKLQSQSDQVHEAVVVGGGIVGVGVARALTLRGIKPVLFEKGDFASGTSSKTSKLIHGGLRYLEMMDFHLVFEALAERHWLLKTHPHLVKPLEFVLPNYEKKNAPPKSRSMSLMRAGLWLYDSLSLFRSPFFHGYHDEITIQKMFPGIQNQGLLGGAYYADAMMQDDELVMEVAADAVNRGAQVLNYCEVVNVSEKKQNGVGAYYEVTVRASHTGSRVQEFVVKAREVIVCAGPWTMTIDSRLSGGTGRKLKPSRGVHLVIPWQRFPIDACMVMFAPDGRIVFVIPRKDFGPGAEMVVVGTTDGPQDENLDEVAANQFEVDYLLNILQQFFPKAQIQAKDIVNTFCGVRPLMNDGHADEAKTSREHEIWRNKEGIVVVAGGKYTTFRTMADEIVDIAFPKTKGKGEDSHSVISEPSEYEARFEKDRSPVLFGRYTEAYLKWVLEHHSPLTLEDVVMRRMPLWYFGKSIDEAVLARIVEICAQYFEWDQKEISKQLQILKDRLSRDMRSVPSQDRIESKLN